MVSVHENYIIHITDENFYIQPYPNKTEEILVICRFTNECKLSINSLIPDTPNQIICHGILGSIRLISGYYLLVISSKTKIGSLLGNDIYRVENFELISYVKNEQNKLMENENKSNEVSKKMIHSVLQASYFYFSYTYDLTHSLQQLNNFSPDFISQPLLHRANPNYVWNSFLINTLDPRKEFSNYMLPLLHGIISMNKLKYNDKTVEFALISRRSNLNAGTRFNVRGIDDEGNPANFVETEQIVISMDVSCSFVQIRGSIPIYWTQKTNLKYKPKIIIDESKNHNEGFQKHLNTHLKHYENKVLINLINAHGMEGNLEKRFQECYRLINEPNLKYEFFDFHKQCGKDRWDRLSILINRLANDQDSFGYFCVNKNGTVLNSQTGVFRTNCIDCLDRTNVVQSLLAKRVLQIQLIKLSVISENDSVETNYELHQVFRDMWADNGDFLSKQYAGTGALKADFTRTGKRTTYGMVRDGVNSLHRYYLNNFQDGFRQDSIDLFLGNYDIHKDDGKLVHQSQQEKLDLKYLALPIIALGTFSMFIMSLMIPGDSYQEQLTFVLFWAFGTMVTLSIIILYGKEFVNTPKFVQKVKKQ